MGVFGFEDLGFLQFFLQLDNLLFRRDPFADFLFQILLYAVHDHEAGMPLLLR
jgi:hypothetical protein